MPKDSPFFLRSMLVTNLPLWHLKEILNKNVTFVIDVISLNNELKQKWNIGNELQGKEKKRPKLMSFLS